MKLKIHYFDCGFILSCKRTTYIAQYYYAKYKHWLGQPIRTELHISCEFQFSWVSNSIQYSKQLHLMYSKTDHTFNSQHPLNVGRAHTVSKKERGRAGKREKCVWYRLIHMYRTLGSRPNIESINSYGLLQ